MQTRGWIYENYVQRLCQPEENLSFGSNSQAVRIFVTRYTNQCCYIARLSPNKMSTVISWLLVSAPDQTQMYPYRDTIARTPSLFDCLFVFAIWLFKEKSKYITKHLMYGPSGN